MFSVNISSESKKTAHGMKHQIFLDCVNINWRVNIRTNQLQYEYNFYNLDAPNIQVHSIPEPTQTVAVIEQPRERPVISILLSYN